jgi:wyosine [tRNA(Phe)-imidazoG37] synthetase (radical SAM superfamily)
MRITPIAFGPVPSRRLGRSLGINNIPPKVCTYSCVYCQLGRTPAMDVARRAFYAPGEVAAAVQAKVSQARAGGEAVDYLTFVPDGEPTLDRHLGETIALLRPLGIPIAVITNASLIWLPDVRADLYLADWVSLKIDATSDVLWRRIDRPQASLSLQAILDGAAEFSDSFTGTLATETMLVAGINDSPAAVLETAAVVAGLRPAVAYLAIPTRPPAEVWVRPPEEEPVNRAYQIFAEQIARVEYLIGYEGTAFACTGNATEDLLAITAVHPMRKDAVDKFLARAGAGWSLVDGLVAQGELVAADYGGATFFLRRFSRPGSHPVANHAINRN